MDSCQFCAILRGQAPAKYVHSWPDAIAIVPLAPVTPGHVIVIPRLHVGDFTADPVVTAAVMSRAATLAAAEDWQWNLITSAGEDATQTICHLHVHLVPRRPGDGLHLPWTGQDGERADYLRSVALDHDGAHEYLSTGCLHDDCEHCRSTVAADGHTKTPGTCKFCTAVCVCPCHREETASE